MNWTLPLLLGAAVGGIAIAMSAKKKDEVKIQRYDPNQIRSRSPGLPQPRNNLAAIARRVNDAAPEINYVPLRYNAPFIGY